MSKPSYRRESLCSSCQQSCPSRVSDMCIDCEAEENPMFLYTIYESDEEEVFQVSNHKISPPGSPRFHLDLSQLPPPSFSFQNYSSSVESGSTFLSDTLMPSPSYEGVDFYTPISTPGSFTAMMKERKGYIFEVPQEPQDYFPLYLSPQSVDPEIKRSGPVRIPRSPGPDPKTIYNEVDSISARYGGPQSPQSIKITGPRSFYTPK
ncbi:hypothetical protein H072_7621 [Dactylellina haptotyla CBS 200.50]|uniref:Uncharacterized protein n=1 Tax=Dactylellina haptotyla (strain CBS 200.50) TaxID=1284197 RepID=S8BH75_DACHA|nr:hypothetical protein H072_7621 [Dactylellina haptotyla CBS 200.50]